ncbi:unnamed protein product [Echinostoma caproni]|uniref:Omp85 domain-containing protein n=1 Tax=Echinostoma caproni TaxID=27848 RepID=A0A183A3Z8_9TREM|nr:unnamed protein product [Echinostoma caproni]
MNVIRIKRLEDKVHTPFLSGHPLKTMNPVQQLCSFLQLSLSHSGSTLNAPLTRLSNCIYHSANPLNELVGKPRAVFGTGLVIRFAGILRIELNYCVPIHSQPEDALKSGFSLGLGLNYS